MQYSNDKTCCKIGRSNNVGKRKRSLEASQNFFVNIVATFPGAGHLEQEVHSRLASKRSNKGPGKEWFNLTATRAIDAVNKVLQQAA